MAWTDKTFVAGDRLTAANLNLWLRDNLNHLKRPQQVVNTVSKGSNITTTSASYALTDGLFVAVITPSIISGVCDLDVTVSFALQCSTTATKQLVSFRLDLNGSPTTAGAAPNFVVEGNNTVVFPVCVRFRIPNVAPGANTLNLAWKTNGGTATIYANTADTRYMEGQFAVVEA